MKTLAFCLAALALSGCAVAKEEACQDLDGRFKAQVESAQMDAAETALAALREACPSKVWDDDALYFTDAIAAQANALADRGDLSGAENLLRRAKRNSWTVSSLRGYIESQRQPPNWREVSRHYGHAVELLAELGEDTLRGDPQLAEASKKIYAQAEQAQLLYGKPDPEIRRDGQQHGLLRAALRLRDLKQQQDPLRYGVHFDTDQASLNEDGRATAEELARFLVQKKPARVVVYGYADERGQHNQELSERRARTVVAYFADYFRKNGAGIVVEGIGKGVAPPLEPQFANLDKAKQWALSRRVDLDLSE